MSKPIDLSTRRFLQALAGAAAALAAGCAMRDPNKPPELGFEYVAVPNPVPNLSGSRFEVLEFFWYGCPFCNSFEPVLEAWASRKPADVALRRVHPAMNPGWRLHQQLFYALEVLGKADEVSPQVFHALHDRQMSLDTPERIADFVAGQGVDRQTFLRTLGSPEVLARCEKATALARSVKLDGVPALLVNGKWMTSPSMMSGSREGALRVVDYLIAQERGGG